MKNIVRSFVSLIVFAIVLSGIYPLIIFGIGQVFFPSQANGSLIYDKTGRVVGSELIGQNFTDPAYFHPRPSAAKYDASNSQGANLGPTSQKLKDNATLYRDQYIRENSLAPTTPIPIDAITSSASGLDPHISVKNALLQARRVANARKIPQTQVILLIKRMTINRVFGLFGEPRINVLLLNLKLDEMSQKRN